MLQAVNKKLDMMKPDELSQNSVTEWLITVINTEREINGVVAAGVKTKKQAESSGQTGDIPK
jgi:hypothetical protein